MCGKSSSSSFVCIQKEVRTDLLLHMTSDAEKLKTVCRIHRKWMKSKFLYRDIDVVSLHTISDFVVCPFDYTAVAVSERS